MIQPQTMTKRNWIVALLEIKSGLYYFNSSSTLLKLVSTIYCSLFILGVPSLWWMAWPLLKIYNLSLYIINQNTDFYIFHITII